MVKTAVIVAAGLGSRLKERTKLIPKGFLELNGKSLIQRSVDNLLEAGVEKILIGTGYLNEVYDEFASKYDNIVTIKSDRYKTTSSMYTMYNMRDSIDGEFFLLESDLLYEKDALKILNQEEKKDVILASGATLSDDEVFIETDGQGFLVGMSKRPEDLNNINGELVGISKISYEKYREMCDYFQSVMDEKPKIDYEYVMVATSKNGNPFYVKKEEDLAWCEIDDEAHLKRALEKVLPKIEGK